MFNWLKTLKKHKVHNKSNISKDHFLQDAAIRRRIHQLQMLVGVTQEDFQALYMRTIEQYVNNSRESDLPTNRSVFVGVLGRVMLALKKRRGYLLPLGAESETSFREREEWTFAVFTAALFKQLNSQTGFELAKTYLPPAAFSWLERNKNLFYVWQRYLQGDGGENNIFMDIVGNGFIGQDADNQVNCLITQIRNEQDNAVNIVHNITRPIASHLSQNDFKSSRFSSHDFWAWLREGIDTKTLTYNQGDSIVHGVESGLFIAMPEAVELFFSDQCKKYGLDVNTLTLAQRIELTKAIKKREGLLRNGQGTRTHVYCIGQWQDRKLVSGLVIPTEVLFDADFRLPIHSALVMDPLSDI